MCGVTGMNRTRNEYIRRSFYVTNIAGQMRENKLRWLGHVERRNNIVKKIGEIRLEENRGFNRSKNNWLGITEGIWSKLKYD